MGHRINRLHAAAGLVAAGCPGLALAAHGMGVEGVLMPIVLAAIALGAVLGAVLVRFNALPVFLVSAVALELLCGLIFAAYGVGVMQVVAGLFSYGIPVVWIPLAIGFFPARALTAIIVKPGSRRS